MPDGRARRPLRTAGYVLGPLLMLAAAACAVLAVEAWLRHQWPPMVVMVLGAGSASALGALGRRMWAAAREDARQARAAPGERRGNAARGHPDRGAGA
jgi:CHASE2 domain-containing sensor protein